MTLSFPDHVALLSELLSRHHSIVEQIESRVLNVQGKDTARNRSRDYFDRLFSSCFYDTPGLPRELSDLRGQLAASHIADGFEPVVLDSTAHTLDPLELKLITSADSRFAASSKEIRVRVEFSRKKLTLSQMNPISSAPMSAEPCPTIGSHSD